MTTQAPVASAQTGVLLTCASIAGPVGSAVCFSAWLCAPIARFVSRAGPLRVWLCTYCGLDLSLSIDLAGRTPSNIFVCLLCLAASMASSLCHKLLLSSRLCCFLLGMCSPSMLLARAGGNSSSSSSSSYDMLSLRSWRGCFAINLRHNLSLGTFLTAAGRAVIVLPPHLLLGRHGGTLRNLQQSSTVVPGVADATWPDPCVACGL